MDANIIKFNLAKFVKQPSFENIYYKINIWHQALKEYTTMTYFRKPFEAYLIGETSLE